MITPAARCCLLLLLVATLVVDAQAQRRGRSDPLKALGIEKAKPFPDRVLPDLDGRLRSLSEFRGKKLLVLNFASW